MRSCKLCHAHLLYLRSLHAMEFTVMQKKWNHSLEGRVTKQDLQMFQAHSQIAAFKLLTETFFHCMKFSGEKSFVVLSVHCCNQICEFCVLCLL